MADRILTWYLEEVKGDGTNQGIAYCLDTGYALPARVRVRAQIPPSGADLILDIKADGESIFGTYTTQSRSFNNSYSEIEYHTLSGLFQNRETISGGTSFASAEITDIHRNIGHMDVELSGTTKFTVGEIITGAPSTATAVVDAFVLGGLSHEYSPVTNNYRAVLIDGQTSEDNAENFASDKTLLSQYSWITLDVIQSGGAKGISVALELDRDYKQKASDEES